MNYTIVRRALDAEDNYNLLFRENSPLVPEHSTNVRSSAVDEERVEQFIAKCTNSQDPQKIIEVVDKIGQHIAVPLEELEEQIKQKYADYSLSRCR